MSSLAKHVIHRPKPLRTVLLLILVAAVTFTAQWFVQQKQADKVQEHIQHLMDKQQQQQNDNKKSLALAKQHYAQKLVLERSTTEQLQQQIVKLQDQVLSLNKDLLFYQTVTQGTGSSKLQIRELYLRADEKQANLVRYRLAITQGKKIKNAITGSINIILNVDNNGTIEQHALKSQQLNLRHVQVLEGQIKITDNLKPLTIDINLIQKKKIALSRTFDWLLATN
ncbi:MAG: hypothetical protein PSN44_02890 [Gammaproteobacteria bacterium]|nr:hypothetical protein [Gammaproteobacteria bacterium]